MMKHILLSLAVLPVLLFTACEAIPHDMLLELNPPDEESDLTVSQLIERVREATDPKGVYLNCNGYILHQTAISKEKRGKTVVDHYTVTEKKFRQPGQMRQTTYQNGAPILTLLFRDNKAWIIDKNGKAEEYQGQGMELFKNYIGFSDPKATEQTLFTTVELGVVYLDGARTYRMICRTSDPNLPPYVEYIDAKTFLLVRLETVKYTPDGKQLRYTAEPRDYHWISDVMLPGVTLVTVGDNVTEEYETTEFVINPDLSDLDFQVDEGTKIDMLQTK